MEDGAFGIRDPAACGSCNSIYTDNYTVNLFNQTGTLPKIVNRLYYNIYNNSHGIGAGSVELPFQPRNDT
jgi:hypothetical protein